jgi:NADH:ubiquinone reductase (H+-translocating)
MDTQVIKIVVVGGGFAGLNFLKRLANDPRYVITLVDINNYHFFPPLLYQVAMALIEPSNIIYPFRRFFQKRRNIRFYLGTAVKVIPETNSVITETGVLSYDYLILAVGTEPKYFGMENVKRNAYPLKTIFDAINLRNHLLLNVEKAIHSNDPQESRKLLNVVIAGGGPTGVEVAGRMAEMVKILGPKEYPEITPGTFRIYLIQGAPVLLKPMSEKAHQEALSVLTRLGVIVILNRRVTDYVGDKVILDNGETIATRALLWTSGVVGREVPGLPASSIGHSQRIIVDDHCLVRGTTNIFAIGDISLNTNDKRYPEGHPQLAQVAIQQGKLLANNFKTGRDIRTWKRFQYKDKGSMAIISKYEAVADLPKVFFKGFGAWLAWLFIHLIPIAGFRNKFNLVLSWAWAFITNNPTLRLIIRPHDPDIPREDSQPEKIGSKRTDRPPRKKSITVTR